MSEDNLLRKRKEGDQNQDRKNYIPVIFLVVAIPLLIWGGFYKGSMAREAYLNNKASGPVPELIIDTLPSVVLHGKLYEVIAIDSLVWMANNLNYDIGEGSLCFDNDASNCSKYGRLYTYNGAMTACKEMGWRLPSKTEWDALKDGFGSDQNAYHALIKGGKTGFNALLGGGYNFYDNEVENPETIGSYWSATEFINGENYAWKYAFRSKRSFMSRDLYVKKWAFSCRCVKPVSSNQFSQDENTTVD